MILQSQSAWTEKFKFVTHFQIRKGSSIVLYMPLLINSLYEVGDATTLNKIQCNL
jgi:hypothetical protein